MGAPHKHRDVIIAWANGAEIQHLDEGSEQWVDNPDPLWCPLAIYRVKPNRVTKEGWVNVYKNCNETLLGHTGYVYPTEEKANAEGGKPVACIRIEWEEEV